jgi:tetratricopeptide (TPR) repeat protein
MNRFGSPLHDVRTAALLVGVLAGAIYLNALGNGFAYDDIHIVQDNTRIHSWETLPEALVVPYWPGDYGHELGLWRPVATAVLGVQHILGGGAPFVFHAVNVLAHVGTSLLVLVLFRLLLSAPAAFAGALLFAVHPIHAEAVANIVGFSELVSAAAIVGALIVHIRGGPVTSWSTALVMGLLYAIGFGSKESAVTLPGLVLLVDAARSRLGVSELPRYLADRWRAYLVLFVVSMALLWARFQVLGSIASPFAPLGGDLLNEIPRIWTLGEVWVHYVRLWAFPLDLSSDYSPGVIPISFGWRVDNALGVGLALLFLTLALIAWRRPDLAKGRNSGKAAAFGGVWFLIAISPISNTVFLSGVLLAERTLYLPSVGLAAATGWLVVRLAQDRKRVAWVGLAIAVLASSVRTWARNPSWYDNATMLTTLIDDYPQSGRSQWVLGDVLVIRGRVSEGLRSYRAAIDLLGTHYQLLTEISKRLMGEEHYRAAEVLLRFAIHDSPQYPLAHGLVALIRAEHGDAEGTEAYARASLEREDVDPTRHHLLAWALASQERFEEAADARARGLEQGRAVFWQQYMYEAYTRRAEGDSVGAYAAVDTAWSRVFTDIGREALDSVRVTEFGLESWIESVAEQPARER